MKYGQIMCANENRNKKRGIAALIVGQVIWGFSALYWQLDKEIDTLYLLLMRIVFATITCICILLIQKKMDQLKEAIINKSVLKREVPAALCLAFDWIFSLYTVRNGLVQEASLGYYLQPLCVFFVGAIIFHEKMKKQHILILGLIVIGITISAAGFNRIPVFAILLGVNYGIYAGIKKSLRIDSIVSTSLEIMILLPVAIVILICMYSGGNAVADITGARVLFLIGSGVITALPFIFASIAVKNLSMMTVACGMYICPTLTLISSFIMGEEMSIRKLIGFAFIWTGIVVYMVDSKTDGNTKESSAEL